MIKLTERDVDVLLSLRFGIVDEKDLIEELFASTEIDGANYGFQDALAARVECTRKEIEEKNKNLMEVSLQLIELCFSQEQLRESLLKVAKSHGKHHGRKLTKLIKGLKHFDQNSVFRAYQNFFEERENDRTFKRQRMLCRRVMKRLLSLNFVRTIDTSDRFTAYRYYHLTKKIGKPWLRQNLDCGLPYYYDIVAHNYHPMHAKHDAMVTQVTKLIITFSSTQGYSLVRIANEDEIKSTDYTLHNERQLRWNTRFVNNRQYMDVLLVLRSGLDDYIINVEIDNGSQPFCKVYGKMKLERVPTIIVCADPKRAQYLSNKFSCATMLGEVFITTMRFFRLGGIFESLYYNTRSRRMGKITLGHLKYERSNRINFN